MRPWILSCLAMMLFLPACRKEQQPPPKVEPPPPLIKTDQPEQSTQTEKVFELRRLSEQDWPSFEDTGDRQALRRALARQVAWLQRKPDCVLKLEGQTINQAGLLKTLTRFQELLDSSAVLAEAIAGEFAIFGFYWQNQPDVLITGYHSPVVKGRLQPDARFKYPLYRVPDDAVTIRAAKFNQGILRAGDGMRHDRIVGRLENKTVLPYFTREEIDEHGALQGKGLELVWLESYMDQFLFHVQGGGFVQLEDGRYLKLNFAGKNSRPYRSIGKILVASGKIPKEEISIQAINAWFEKHPEDLKPTCYQNKSYVFYQMEGEPQAEMTPDMYPSGVYGFPVTPMRSIATDKRYFKGGLLAYLQGTQRQLETEDQPIGAFVLDQDTGGAITDNHVDFFQGAGKEAEARAGLLNDEQGRLYLLILKELVKD